jgi:hypothetical protein
LGLSDWNKFHSDAFAYLDEVSRPDGEISIQRDHLRNYLKTIAILRSLSPAPSDNGGVTMAISDEELRRLRISLRALSNATHTLKDGRKIKGYGFSNLDKIQSGLPDRNDEKLA